MEEEEEKVVREQLTDFNRQMLEDGHDERFRGQKTRTVVEKWKERVKLDREGTKSYYRTRQEILASKIQNKTSWYKDRGCDGVLKVTCTPKSLLAKRIKARIRSKVPGKKILVQETIGSRFRDRLSSPWEPWGKGS